MQIYFDEAGRGPLAWSLYIGLVISKLDRKKLKAFPFFKDSKQLSEKQREVAFKHIQELVSNQKLIATVASVENTTIDEFGLTQAVFIAICKGIYRLITTLLAKTKKDTFSLQELQILIKERESKYKEKTMLILDGKSDFWLWKILNIQTECIIHWDDQIPEISIASILAKVSRDHYMYELAEKYPEYHFDKHKGYGTKAHYQAIEHYGISEIHRKLFLKKIFPDWKIKKFNKLQLLNW